MQSKESKIKLCGTVPVESRNVVERWFEEAASVYAFIHWEERFKLVPQLEVINGGLELKTGTICLKAIHVSESEAA